MTAERTSNLVSAEWLRAHLGQPDLVVLDARVGPAETAGGKPALSRRKFSTVMEAES